MLAAVHNDEGSRGVEVLLLDHRLAIKEGIVLMYEGDLGSVGGYRSYLSPQQLCPCLLVSVVESGSVGSSQSHCHVSAARRRSIVRLALVDKAEAPLQHGTR